MPEVAAAPASEIARKIMIPRGQRVLLDADLPALYGTTTKALNQAGRRNIARFPADFVFQLNQQEFGHLMSQFATSRKGGVGAVGLRLCSPSTARSCPPLLPRDGY